MKVHVVFVKREDYNEPVVDGVYANKEDADRRAREIAFVEEREVL